MDVFILRVLSLVLMFQLAHSAFNCNRPGSKCVQGSCDYNQVCSCHKGYTGFMCDMETARIVDTCPATVKCKAGKCTKDATGTVTGCHCDYEYYGPACDKPRYTLDCYYDRMLIGLNPVGFRGHIRYIDKLTSSACDLKPLTDLKKAGVTDFDHLQWDGYGIVAMHKQDVCNGESAYSTTHGFDIYSRKLVVQYYDRVYVSLDEIVTFICAVETNNPVNVMSSVFTAPLEEGFLDKAQVRGVGTHFIFSLHKSQDDAAIGDGDTLGVGALVFLKVKIREHSPFATLIIESCGADDGNGTNSTANFSFHDQGCPVEPVGQWIMKPNAKEFHLYFKIFRFEETNELRITCVVRGCTSWDSPSCSISQCSHVDRRRREAAKMHTIDAELAGARHTIDAELAGARHKRQTGGATGRPKKRNSNIVLNDKGHAPVNKLNSSEVIRLTVVITDKKKNKAQQQGIVIREVAAPSFQACTLSFEFWILIIGMTVVVVALTATTVSCALKRRKLKNRKKRHNDKAVKMALNNMKRMQMSSLPWNFYNR